MGNTELMKRKRAEQVRVTGVNKRNSHGRDSRAIEEDVRTPIVDPPATAKDAYPIAGLTFLLVPKKAKTPAKGQAVKDFVEYIVMHGQDEAEKLYYAKLPTELQQQDEKLLAEVGAQSN